MNIYNIDCIEITWSLNPMCVADVHAAVTVDGVTSYGSASGCCPHKAAAAVMAALSKNENNPLAGNNFSEPSMQEILCAFEIATGKKVIRAISKDYYDLLIIE